MSYSQSYHDNWLVRGMGGLGAVYSPSIIPFNPNEAYMGCDMGLSRKHWFWTHLENDRIQYAPWTSKHQLLISFFEKHSI